MTRQRTVLWMVGATLALLVAVGLAAWILIPGGDRADPTDTTEVALGRVVYAERCASCHGASLEGQPDWRTWKPDGCLPAPPHDASGHTWHHPDEDLFKITKQGAAAFAPPGYASDMPAFGDILGDTAIWAVLAYIKSTWPDETRRRHAAMSEQAKK